MTNQKLGYPHIIFWSMCAVLVLWAAITIYFETRMGLPADRSAWGHRAIGWFINIILVRTFMRGMRRYYSIQGK